MALRWLTEAATGSGWSSLAAGAVGLGWPVAISSSSQGGQNGCFSNLWRAVSRIWTTGSDASGSRALAGHVLFHATDWRTS